MDVATQRKSEMTLYLNNGYDVMNCFAKFEKFLPHSMFYMSVESQSPESERGDSPHKIGSQNTPYKLGLRSPFLITILFYFCEVSQSMNRIKEKVFLTY